MLKAVSRRGSLTGVFLIALAVLVLACAWTWIGQTGLPAQAPQPRTGAGATEQEGTASPTAAGSPAVTSTLASQASRRLSMPLLFLPATPTPRPPSPTAWPKPSVQQLTEDVLTVAAGGGFAYLGTRKGLIVVGVQDPTRPRVLSRLDFGWPKGVEAVDIHWLGTRVVVLGLDRGFYHDSPLPGSHLMTVDVRDPTAPRLLQQLPQHEISFTMDRVGDALVLGGMRGGPACNGADGGLLVYDAGKGDGLTRIACYPLTGFAPLAVAAEQTEVLLTAISVPGERNQFAFWFDLTDPSRPLLRRRERIQADTALWLIARQQGRSVMGGFSSDLLLIEDAFPDPVPLQTAAVGDQRSCGLSGIAKLDGEWFLRMGSGCDVPALIRWSGRLQDPTPRGEIDRIAMQGQVYLQPSEGQDNGWNSVAAAEGLVFLVDHHYGGILTIVDVSGGGPPRIVGRMD